jgi:hypothetical protein
VEEDDDERYEDDDDEDRLDVSSKGNVSATLRVPRLINIPSDGQAHNVTIVQLKLDASMIWAKGMRKPI